MMIWNFTLHLRDLDEFTDELTERLYGSFSDGTLASSNGCSEIMFGREAATLQDAIRTAVNDVRYAGLAIDHVEIDSDELDEAELAHWATA